MIITCPECGEKVAVKGLGRKPLNIPLKNVYECLRKYRSVGRAAQELGCSQGYIFNLLKANGLGLKDVLPRHSDATTERLSPVLEDKVGLQSRTVTVRSDGLSSKYAS